MPSPKTDAQVLSDHSMQNMNGCIDWTGHKDKDGYGKCRRNSKVFGSVYLPHRLAYMMAQGLIPDGCEIDHLCKNRCCINPDHLQAVTHVVNVERGDYKTNHRNSAKTHCKRGHEFTEENTFVEKWRGIVMRRCRVCNAAKNARSNEKRKLMLQVHGIRISEVA